MALTTALHVPRPRGCIGPAAVGAGHRPARIDYLLTSGHAVAAELALADTGQGFSYSDHLGVAAVLRFGGASDSSDTPSNGGNDGGPGSNRFRVGAPRGSPARLPGGSPQNRRSRQQQDGAEGEHAELCLRGRAAFTHLMRRWPAPFQHAATSIEAAAGQMRQGRRQFVQLAAGLWAAGFGCLGALLARPWWQQRSDLAGSSHVALLSGVGAAFGWAGRRSACAVFGSAQQPLLPAPVAKPWPGVWDVVPAILHSCLPRRVTYLAVHARSPTLLHGRPCHTCRCADNRWVCGARRGDASAAAGRKAAQAGSRLLRGHRLRCKPTCPLCKGFTQCPCQNMRKGETLSKPQNRRSIDKDAHIKSLPTWERQERLALLARLHCLRCGGHPSIWHPESFADRNFTAGKPWALLRHSVSNMVQYLAALLLAASVCCPAAASRPIEQQQGPPGLTRIGHNPAALGGGLEPLARHAVASGAAASGPLRKRGVGATHLTLPELTALKGLAWWYSWGPRVWNDSVAQAAADAGVEFVPMQVCLPACYPAVPSSSLRVCVAQRGMTAPQLCAALLGCTSPACPAQHFRCLLACIIAAQSMPSARFLS